MLLPRIEFRDASIYFKALYPASTVKNGPKSDPKKIFIRAPEVITNDLWKTNTIENEKSRRNMDLLNDRIAGDILCTLILMIIFETENNNEDKTMYPVPFINMPDKDPLPL